MTNVARPLRGLVPVLAAFAAATAVGPPVTAAVAPAASRAAIGPFVLKHLGLEAPKDDKAD